MTHAARSLGIAMLLLLSSVFIVGVLAQDTNREDQPNGHGIVIDAVTGKPLHALVFIVSPERDIVFTAETGEDGIFKLHLPPGEYVWEAESEHHHPGRGEFMVGERGWEVKIVLEPIEEPKEPEVPEFNIGGMLINVETGEGVPGFIGFINPDGKAIEMETEEDGEFRILLFPGPWMWKAGARGFKAQEGRLMIEREPVRLMIEMVPLNNEEPEQRWAVLYGHVATPEGKPIPGAMVSLHPMMMEEPPVRPGIPEDPPERPMTSDRDPNTDPATRQSEREEISISFREFFARFSERLDEGTLKRIFSAADADADGVLNEREMVRAHELLREHFEEGTPERPPAPEREPLHAVTNEDGMFRMRIPFGEFITLTEARGFHPNEMPIRISPRQQEHKIRIVLEPMREPERERERCGRMKIVFNMEDHDSDGNPEFVKFAADLNGDCIHEIEYHMVDRNSDGNPESVEWVLDIPLEMCEKVMGIIMRLVEKRGTYEDINWGEWGEIKEEWEGYEGEDAPPMDFEYILDLIAKKTDKDPDMAFDDKDAYKTDDEGNKETDDLKNGDLDPSGVTDKGSSNKGDTPVLEILAAIGVLSFMLAILIGFGVYIRKKRE